MTEPADLTLLPTTRRRSWWASLLTFAGPGSVTVENGTWRLEARRGTVELPAEAVTSVSIEGGLFWATLVVQTWERGHHFGGLRRADARALVGAFHLQTLGRPLALAVDAWRELAERPRYLNHHAWSAWRDQTRSLRAKLRDAPVELLPATVRALAATFTGTHDHLLARVREHNAAHLTRELAACATLFDRIESNPLTARQREAIVTDEDNTLVVAGAGTGKTSVVVGKVAYLVRRLGVPPGQVLLLAYNRDARKELEERLEARLGVDVTASTFHALGYRILGETGGRRPDLHTLATDPAALGAFIDGVLRAMLTDTLAQAPLLRHIVEHLRPYKAPGDFPNLGGYFGWLKSANIRTLQNEQVKSYEEAVIADWLFVNGIDYTYEAPYAHDTATSRYRQYKPDFTLHPQQGRTEPVYVEHWGTNRDGRPAPHIDRERYQERMRWARETHRTHRTTLVETFSYDRKEGRLVERLQQRLAAQGLTPRPRPAHEIEAAAERRGVFSTLAKLLGTFLQHFKAGRYALSSLRRSDRAGEPSRRDSFLAVFERVYDAYQRKLADDRAIDFIDMIGLATDAVEAGRFQSPWSYVIVDEFQDIAPHRARLLRALLDQVDDRRLTCVGDDWQSIYRFAGADIGLMTGFDEHFGYTASVELDRTFRFGRRLLQASATFIQENPAQLRKSLTANRDEGLPPVVVLPCAARPQGDREAAARLAVEEIRAVLQRIARESPSAQRSSVMLLGRYRHNRPPCTPTELLEGLPQLDVEFRTVHRSKGLQADHVVVLKVTSGRYGFPSEVEDDPLLGMVLTQHDEMEHAEERRLFYVALTRARRRVFLLTQESMRSPFVEELMKPAYRGLVEAPGQWMDPVPCPDCGATLVRRVNGKTGKPFWSCVHYPYCNGSMEVCAECQTGALVRNGRTFQCNNGACDASAEACPTCGEGMLRKRQNGRDQSWFWACSRWRRDGTGCGFTRDVGARRTRGRRFR